MREVYEVPTVIQYSYQFPVAVKETVKRTTNCSFNYFTNRGSYYDVPENMVSFEELPNIPCPTKQNSTQQDLSTMRKWAKEFGRSSQQLTVRAKTTKDNPGTLPVTAYSRRGLVGNPSSSLLNIRSNIYVDSDTSTSDDEDDFVVDCVPVTMYCVSTITFK